MDYRKIIVEEFSRRKRVNSNYSLRAFARDLDCPPSRLSEILSGKAGLSVNRAEHIATKIGLAGNSRACFTLAVEQVHGKSRASKIYAKEELDRILQDVDSKFSLSRFRMIADWYFMAILEGLKVPKVQRSVQKLAKLIGIKETTAQEAVASLVDMGVIQKRGRRFGLTSENLYIGEQVPSSAIRHFHEQILSKARYALLNHPVKDREFSASMIAIDAGKIAEFKSELLDLRRKFCKSVTTSSLKKDDLYCLSIQFFHLREED